MKSNRNLILVALAAVVVCGSLIVTLNLTNKEETTKVNLDTDKVVNLDKNEDTPTEPPNTGDLSGRISVPDAVETPVPQGKPLEQPKEDRLTLEESLAKEWFDIRESNNVLNLDKFTEEMTALLSKGKMPQIVDNYPLTLIDTTSVGINTLTKYADDFEVTLVSVVLPEIYGDTRVLNFVQAITSDSVKANLVSKSDWVPQYMELQNKDVIVGGILIDDHMYTETDTTAISVISLGKSPKFSDMAKTKLSEIGIKERVDNNTLYLTSEDGSRYVYLNEDFTDNPEEEAPLTMVIESTIDSLIYTMSWDGLTLHFNKEG